MEKPYHVNPQECRNYIKLLNDNNLYNRVLVGYHDSLH